MDGGVIVVGLVLLAVLAVTIGRITRDGYGGTDRAWRAIAAERRRIWEERQRIHQLQSEFERCRDCPFRGTPPGRRR